ncbi:MAG: IS1380 family transposase [Bacteroidetes bacterium]|nr:IS1380 family transposase [Bacteroidota bacterium]
MGGIDKIEFSDHSVTAWGGMKLMKDLLDASGMRDKLSELPLPEKGSNRGYDPVQIMECFWVSIWIGAGRFSHSAYLRFDDVLKQIFQWKQAPSQSTYSRYFAKFNWKRNTETFVPLFQWFHNQIRFNNLTLDLDSTVVTRYGEQEGAKKGYNPKKPGRNSHHPLMAFIPEVRMVANAWLRQGNTGSSNNAKAFLEETMEILKEKKVGLIRCDSGFYTNDFLSELERKALNYITAVKFYPTIKRELLCLSDWIEIKRGVEICEFEYQSPDWKRPRRIVAVRKSIEKLPKSTGKLLLFDEPAGRYRYSAYVTNMDLPAEQIWEMYKQRGDAENRIKELKYDFALDTFCMNNFWGTEAAFRSILMAYNMLALFRQVVLKMKSQATLSTLRFKCFALGAWITKHARITTLKISATGEKRRWLDALFDTVPKKHPPYFFLNA